MSSTRLPLRKVTFIHFHPSKREEEWLRPSCSCVKIATFSFHLAGEELDRFIGSSCGDPTDGEQELRFAFGFCCGGEFFTPGLGL